jgi:pimeloyl-ACP methyl ester carboxylesterase
MADVVLVHGLWMRSWSLAFLGHRLEKEGFSIHPFNYSTWRRDPAASTGALADFCRKINAKELHLVGHSLGGLLILKMLQQLNQQEQHLPAGKVVLLGSPIGGSHVANRLARSAMGRMLLRHAESSLIDGFSNIPDDRSCGMIAGTVPRGLGQLTGRFEGPNDGTVLLSETQSPDLTAHLELPVTHIGLPFSALVARHLIRFIRTGRFELEN